MLLLSISYKWPVEEHFAFYDSESDNDDDDWTGEVDGSSLWAVQRKILSEKTSQPNIKRESQVAIELKKYLQERPNMGTNPIEFWSSTPIFITLKP
jgi:hypothetical protein